MKKIFLLAIAIISLASCNQDKIQDLNRQIAALEASNKKLTDSLKNIQSENLMRMTAVGFPSEYTSKLNEPHQINYAFCYSIDIDFPEYNVYRVTNADKDEKELILAKQYKSGFRYDFIPKTLDDDTIELLIEFEDINGYPLKMQSITHTVVE
ncbi:hypothetical protein [Kordia jejudonensis]|uniref:hypothetical protein n=1 Tax=Kordia jejudonensis TaxID=1348245 RepID=UPI000628FBB2|nr:hypothetical protein [Kordia jejudonensis]